MVLLKVLMRNNYMYLA